MKTFIDEPQSKHKHTNYNELTGISKEVAKSRKPHAFLLGGAAIASIGVALLSGGEKATPDKESSYSVTYSATETISQGDTPIDAAELAAQGMNEGKGPSDVQLSELQVSTMESTEELRREGHITQPGDTVHVKVGELNGEPDVDGKYGTDVKVTVNTK